MAESDAVELSEAAKCFECLEPGQIEYVKVYLLALIAGGSTDPNVLLEQSSCMNCLTPGQVRYAEIVLLDQIANP